MRNNKTLVLKYYADMRCAPLSELLRKSIIKTKNQLAAFSDFIWQDCPESGKRTGAYIIFYQIGIVDHVTHVPGPVYQLSEESEYNAACSSGIVLAHLSRLIN